MITFIIRCFLGEIGYFIGYLLNFRIRFLFLYWFFILAVQYISFNYLVICRFTSAFLAANL